MANTSIQPLGEALATINGPLIFTEAKRQHEALRATQSNTPRVTRWRVDLQTFYRTQFVKATADLDSEQKLKLLTICFAYKTRDSVLHYLSHVRTDDDEPAFDWVEPIRDVVERAGVDSSTSEDRDAGIPTFTIPTLPIAYPKQFFLAWASLVPTRDLTVANLLAMPAAHGLKLSYPLKDLVRAVLPGFWGADREDAAWAELFRCLFVGREKLWGFEVGMEGYGLMELGVWVEWWKAVRGDEVVEVEEEDESSASPPGAGRVLERKRRWVVEDDEDDDDEEEAPKRKRVRWADEEDE